MKKIILLFLLFFNLTYFAQIDTTVLYPLDIGNYWEYTNYTSIHYYNKVVGEKQMPNGKTYKRLKSVNLIDNDTSYSYYRVEDNNKVFWFRNNDLEFKIFDFTLSEGELWKEHKSLFSHAKVSLKRIEFNPLVQDSLLTVFKEYFDIDTTKVPPDTNCLFDVYSKFAKGIGPTMFGNPIVRLTGLIIKGVKYGDISAVRNDDKEQIINNYELKISSYPNPFNSSTNITFNNPVKQKIKISIMNLLGQEISKIADHYFSQGEQKIHLTMPINISAGTYFILLKTKNKQYTKKILYLK